MAKSNFIVRGGADFSGINKALTKTQQQFSGFQATISKSMGLVKTALASLAVGKFIKDSVSAAMTVESSMGQINRTMGENAAEFNRWAQTQAKSFGMARTEAFKYGDVYSNLLSGFLKGTQETQKYTVQLLQSSAVVASKTGRTMQDTMERIRSGLLGNTEAIEDLGINVNVSMLESTEAFKKFAGNRSWQQLDFQTQQQIRLMAILEQANVKYGDSLSGTTATKQMLFVATLKNIQLNLGQAFLPIYNIVLPALTTLANKLEVITAHLAIFSKSIFGDVTQAVKPASNAMGNLSAGAEDVGKDVKKAGKSVKGALGGFDQLNTITQNTADSMEDIAGVSTDMGGISSSMSLDGTTANVEVKVNEGVKAKFEEIKNAALGAADNIKNAFGPTIMEAFNNLTPSLQTWKETFYTTFSDISRLGEPLKNWFSQDLTPFLNKTILNISEILGGVLDSSSMAFNGIREAAVPVLEWLTAEGLPLITSWANQVRETFMSLFTNAKSIFDRLWREGIQPALNLVSRITLDTLNIVKGYWDKWGEEIYFGIRGAFDNVKSIFDSLWDNFIGPAWEYTLNTLSWLWNEHIKGLVEELLNFVGKTADAALDIFNKFVSPVIKMLVEKLGPIFAESFRIIVDVVGTAVGTIADVVKGIIKALGGVIDFIAGAFTGDWQRAWNGIKDIFGGIWDSIVGILKGGINLIIDAVNALIRGMNRLKIDIPEWSPVAGGQSFGINIPTIPKLAQGGLAYAPTLAMVGDNRGARTDPEVISPLSKLQEMMGGNNQHVVDVLTQILKAIQSQGKQIISVKLGETEVALAVSEAINNTSRQFGKSLIDA